MANGNSGIDEEYFASVTGLEANTSDDNTNTGADDGQQPSNEQTTTSTEQTVDKAASTETQPTVPKPNEGQGEQQQQTQKAPIQGLRKHPSGEYVDGEGNIVRQDGSLVAKSGGHRRQYEENYRLRSTAQELTQRTRVLETELQSRNYLNGVPQQLGLSNEEVAQGLDYVARMKKGDLLGVARDIVAQVAAKGHNISEIVGKDVGDAIDLRAVSAMLDQRLGPITQQAQQGEREQQVRQVAQANYQRFVNDNEYADVHADIIVAFADTNHVSIQQAYNKTREFAIQNGLDFTQPLGPQIEALVAQQEQPQQQQTTQTRPMPNGVSTRDSAVVPTKPVYANADDDWGTIIRGAMQH